jgi:superfamily II DNA or RNA helicase
MISKISEFGPRRDFIVRILADLLEENPEAQIMVLCHTRALLTYFSEAIAHRGFASAGFYVGGMKQCDLQETEGKQIVLATYAMAAEALDIKTLSILVMASPKTDITQSVGRILRVRHENPIIVDIVDRHDVFQNQWRQRKTFYRKCNYRIRSIDSVRYRGMNFDWNTDTTWTRVFDPVRRVFDPIKRVFDPQNAKNPSNCGILCSGDDDDDGPVASSNPLLQRKCLIAIEDLEPMDM